MPHLTTSGFKGSPTDSTCRKELKSYCLITSSPAPISIRSAVGALYQIVIFNSSIAPTALRMLMGAGDEVIKQYDLSSPTALRMLMGAGDEVIKQYDLSYFISCTHQHTECSRRTVPDCDIQFINCPVP